MCCWLRLSSSQLLWGKQDPETRCCPEQEGEALLYKALDLTKERALLHSVQWKRWHKPLLLALFQFPSCTFPAAAGMLQALQSSMWSCCRCTPGASLCLAILPAQRRPASGKAGEAKGQWCSSWAQNHTIIITGRSQVTQAAIWGSRLLEEQSGHIAWLSLFTHNSGKPSFPSKE